MLTFGTVRDSVLLDISSPDHACHYSTVVLEIFPETYVDIYMPTDDLRK